MQEFVQLPTGGEGEEFNNMQYISENFMVHWN